TRDVVIDAAPILRDAAGLSIHLHRARPLVLERGNDVALLIAAQHAQMPAPVVKNRAEVAGTGRGRVGWRPATAAAAAASLSALRAGRAGPLARLRARRERRAERQRHPHRERRA